jgi:hypothetical protein
MKSSLRIIILFVTLSFNKQLFAQNKSFPGFYITSKGDTIKGVFTNYKQWSKNPVSVEFTETATAKLIVLTPENCLKFSIENYDEYLAYSGPRMENDIEYDQVINNKEFAGSADQYGNVVTFLRLIVKNKDVELYILSDNKRLNLFYKLPGQPVLELKYKKYYDENRIHEIPEYRQQIMNLFPAQISKANLFQPLNKLTYSETEMTEFFDKLNSDKKPKYKKKNPAAGWVISGGVSINTFKVIGDKSVDKVRTSYGSSISPLVSVGYFVPIDRNFSRYFIFPQIKFFTYKNTGKLNDGAFIKSTTFKSKLVVNGEINAGMNAVNGKKFRLHISGGGGVMLLLKNKEENQTFVASSNTLYTSSETNHSQITYSVNASAGITIKNRILILTTYNFPTWAGARYVYYSPRMGSFQVRLGYKMK